MGGVRSDEPPHCDTETNSRRGAGISASAGCVSECDAFAWPSLNCVRANFGANAFDKLAFAKNPRRRPGRDGKTGCGRSVLKGGLGGFSRA